MTYLDIKHIVLFNEATVPKFSDVIVAIVKSRNGLIIVRHFVVMEAKRPNMPRFVVGMYDPRKPREVGRLAASEAYHQALDLRMEVVNAFFKNVDDIVVPTVPKIYIPLV